MDAGLKGFADGVNGVTVTISNLPTSGSFLNNKNALQVVVTQQAGISFMGKFYKLAARTVSLLPPSSCLMSLLSTGIAVNTLNMTLSTFRSACDVYIGGNIQKGSSCSVQSTGFFVVGTASSSFLNSSTQPLLKFNSLMQTDPLANVPQPAFARCDFTGVQNQNNSRTLNPCTYCDNSMWCTNTTLKLSPGLYIVTRGVNWNIYTILGTGVALFLTQGSSSSFRSFQAVNSTIALSASTAASQGSIGWIPLFIDRAWSGGNQDVQWSHSTYSGGDTWCSTNTGVQVSSSNVSGSNYRGLVTASMQVQNSSFNALYINSPVALASSSSASAGASGMKLLQSENGSVLLEFSLILPIVVFMFIGMINLGVAVEQGIVVSEAAEAGTKYGTLSSKSTDLTGMQNAATAAASGLSGFSAVATTWCSCVPAGATVNCSSTCPNSSALDVYIQVQTSATVPALANYPGLAASFPLKGFSAMRVQ